MDMDTRNVKQIFDDGWVEFEGRRYEFLRMTHLERRNVLAFVSKYTEGLAHGKVDFLFDPKWGEIEKLLWSRIARDGRILSQEPEYWDTYIQDHIPLIQTALLVIIYPFFPESGTTSRAADLQPAATTPSRKPM